MKMLSEKTEKQISNLIKDAEYCREVKISNDTDEEKAQWHRDNFTEEDIAEIHKDIFKY